MQWPSFSIPLGARPGNPVGAASGVSLSQPSRQQPTLRTPRQRTLLPFLAHLSKEDLMVMREFLEAGTVTPVIDRSFPLSDVPEAIRYLEEGHARGKVVIAIDDRGET
ncbi:MAG: zinc-binding dehydrogenase [Thermoanaerobaculaceae bacterium]